MRSPRATPATALTIALLAGGKSRRMGRDKAFLDLGGAPLAERALAALQGAIAGQLAEVLIAGATIARGERLGAALESVFAAAWRAIPDVCEDAGPMAAILAALDAARTDWVLVGACDRPFVEPRLLRHLVALAVEAPSGTDVVAPVSTRGLEPLLALYHRSLAERLREELHAGGRAIVDFLQRTRILVCPSEVVAALDPEQRSFGNLNSPQDLLDLGSSVATSLSPSRSPSGESWPSGGSRPTGDSPPSGRSWSGSGRSSSWPHASDGEGSPMEREREELFKPVAVLLRAVPTRIREALETREPHVRAIVDHLSRYEGKMLRPALVLLIAGAVRREQDALEASAIAPGSGALRDVLEVAVIVEMVHLATLVHDDVLDEAEIRRRVPSVNARFGNHVAVLLGDTIYARAFQLATSLASPSCAQVLSAVTRELCEGQIAELAACRDFGLGEEGYLRIAEGKTASLYGAATRLGAIYAGADAATASALERFGRDLGLGFQIVDDCLDLSGREEVVGKSLGTDLSEGKITLPLLLAHQRADLRGRRRLEQMFAAPAANAAEALAELRGELDLNGAVEEALRRADRFLRRAAETLAVLPDGPYRACLARVPEYILCREW